jgi:ankyrin repeat protein
MCYRDNGGFTPLHYAAGSFWQEQPDLVRRLLSLGALPTPRDAIGRQAIDLARDKGYGTVVAILRKQPRRS